MNSQPYSCDALGVVQSIVLRADKAAKLSGRPAVELAAAHAEVESCKADYLTDYSEDAAARLADALARERHWQTLANTIEAAGDAGGARDRVIENKQTYDLLGRALDERGAELVKRLAPTRKALGQRLAALGEAGASMVETETDPEVRVLRATIRNAETAIQAAVETRNYCRQWTPGTNGMKFADLHGHAGSPLPV